MCVFVHTYMLVFFLAWPVKTPDCFVFDSLIVHCPIFLNLLFFVDEYFSNSPIPMVTFKPCQKMHEVVWVFLKYFFLPYELE